MRSDYGTLFVVLVIIGVICFIIIVLGLLYNCWQRRLPKLKHVVSRLGRVWDGWSAVRISQCHTAALPGDLYQLSCAHCQAGTCTYLSPRLVL